MVSGAATGAITSAASEAILADDSGQRNMASIIYAGLGGLIIGGLGGAVFGRIQQNIASAALRERQKIEFGMFLDFQRTARDPRVRLNEKGKAYFKEATDPATDKKFLDEVIELMGFDDDELAEIRKSIDDDDLKAVAEKLGHIPDDLLEADRTVGAAEPARFSVGAASQQEIRNLETMAPDWLKAIPDLLKRWARGDVTDEEVVAAVKDRNLKGDPAIQLKKARDKAKIPEKRPGDLFLVGKFNDAKGRRGGFSLASFVGKSKDPFYRGVMNMIVPDAVPKKGAPQVFTALEFAMNNYNAKYGALRLAHQDGYREWLRATGRRRGAKAEKEFETLVSLSVRRGGESPDPIIAKVARKQIEFEDDLLEQAQRHGLMLEIEKGQNYLSRIYDEDLIEEAIEKYGKETIYRLFAKALKSGQEDIDDEAAMRGAIAIVNTLLDRTLTSFEKRRFASGIDREAVRLRVEALRKVEPSLQGIDDEEAKRIVNAIVGTDEIKSTLTRFEKRRIELDETASIQTPDGDIIFLEQFLNNNALDIGRIYARQVSGAMAIREVMNAVGEEIGDEIKSLEQLRNIVERKLADAGLKRDEIEKSLEAFDLSVDVTLGKRIGSRSKAAKVARNIQLYNYTTTGGRFGVASLPELSSAVVAGGITTAFQMIPQIPRLMRIARQGKMPTPLLEELSAITGIGFENGNHAVIGRAEQGGAFVDQAAGGIETMLRKGARAASIISGQAPVTELSKRIAATGVTLRFIKAAHGRAKLGQKRLAAIGLTPEDADAIFEQIRKHATPTEGARFKSDVVLNIHRWDPEVASRFSGAISRWVDSTVQTINIGDLPMFMTKDLARMIFQFRTFSIAAWQKQTLRNIAIRDGIAFQEVTAAGITAALAYMAEQYIASLGRRDADEYREEKLSPEAIIKAAVQRNGFFSIIPAAIDTGVVLGGNKPLFNARTSGLATTPIDPSEFFGNPTFDAFSRATGLVRDTFESLRGIEGKENFTENEFRRAAGLVPFQRLLGVTNMINAIGAELPEDEDR